MSTSSGEGVLVRECYAVLAAGDEIDSDRLFVDGFVPDNIFFISDDAVYLLTARRGQTNAASGAGAQSSRNCFAISPFAVHFKGPSCAQSAKTSRLPGSRQCRQKSNDVAVTLQHHFNETGCAAEIAVDLEG